MDPGEVYQQTRADKVTLHPNGIEIFGNWYSNPALEKRCRDLPQRDYVVRVDEEDLGGISVGIEDGKWLEVAGPPCMNGINVDVWNMALASMRRENKHIEAITDEVVLRALAWAKDIDEKTRARLSIRFRLKTPEELEILRNSIGPAIRHAAKRSVPGRPDKQVDMFSGAISVGTKAPLRSDERVVPASVEAPIVSRGVAKPKRLRPAKAKPTAKAVDNDFRTRKPARPWKPKERK